MEFRVPMGYEPSPEQKHKTDLTYEAAEILRKQGFSVDVRRYIIFKSGDNPASIDILGKDK